MWRSRALGRALTRRCLRCGGRIFSGFFTLLDRCRTCGLRIEREEGYWVGAMIVNIGATLALFVLVFVGILLLSWPDVPWTGLTVATAGALALAPIVGYPWSKTLWWWIDVAFINPPGEDWARWNGDVPPPPG